VAGEAAAEYGACRTSWSIFSARKVEPKEKDGFGRSEKRMRNSA
jgi:hypothetical protein